MDLNKQLSKGYAFKKTNKTKNKEPFSFSGWISKSTQKRIKKRGFLARYRWLFLTCFVGSYFCAVISFSSGFYWVYDGISTVNKSNNGAWIIAFIVLLAVEQFDRKSTSEVAEDWFWGKTVNVIWAIVSIVIFCGSLYLSLDGTNEGGESLLPANHIVVTDSLLNSYVAERALVREEIKTVSAQNMVKEKGKWVVAYNIRLNIIPKKEARIAELNQLIDSGNTELKGKRKLLTQGHQADVKKYTYAAMILVGLFSILRHACIFFIWKYRRAQWTNDQMIDFVESKGGYPTDDEWEHFWGIMNNPIDTPDAISFERVVTLRPRRKPASALN